MSTSDVGPMDCSGTTSSIAGWSLTRDEDGSATASETSDINSKFSMVSLSRANVGVADSSGLDALFEFEDLDENIVCNDPLRSMGFVGGFLGLESDPYCQ